MSEFLNDSEDLPAAIGPYSQAVRTGNLLLLSGQIAVDPETGKMIDGDVSAQLDLIMRNISRFLVNQQLSLKNIVKVVIYMTNMQDYSRINDVYSRWLEDHRPVRAAVAVSALPANAAIELVVTAELAN